MCEMKIVTVLAKIYLVHLNAFFLKTLPTGMPNVVPPLWNADIVKQLDFVSKKLIKSGLLTPSEKEWWQGLTVNRLQDEVHEVRSLIGVHHFISRLQYAYSFNTLISFQNKIG